ncbi:MAG: 8-oxoguanine deaminase [Pseudomonadales bacterium]
MPVEPLPGNGSAARGLVVRGDRIVERVPPGAEPRVDVVFDARGLVLLPGLINTHHHFYQTLTRACRRALDRPLFPWLQALYPVWSGLTPSMIETSTELALSELLLSGCTLAVDHHYVFTETITEAIDLQVAVARRLGLRVVLTRGSMSLGASSGGLPPDRVTQSPEIILRESERLVRTYHDRTEEAHVQVALAPCSPFSVDVGLLRDTARLAAALDVGLHTHLAETLDEDRYCKDTHGVRPLELLARAEWLRPGTWLAHGIHFNTDEIRMLGEAGVGISHCPTSNMLLSSGICKARELERAGAPVGLGVDGSASNDGSNLMLEARQALLLARLAPATRDQPPTTDSLVSHVDALRWATLGGARLLQRPSLGRLEVGALADIACFALDELRFSGAEDPIAALVLCGAHAARHVMVGGRWRVIDGAIPGLDIGALRARHQQLAAQLLSAEAAAT